jgi:Flp pilus assembly pilin Flp
MEHVHSEEGATMAEYGLLLAGIAVVVAASLPTLQVRVTDLFVQALAVFP